MTSAPAPAPASAPISAVRFDTWAWFRRVLIALAAVAVLVLTSGVYLTFAYRPASHVDVSGIAHRTRLVDLSHSVHAVGGYLLVLLVFAAVGLALASAAQRSRAIGVVTASGVGLVFVAIAFVITGRQLPWRSLVFVASGLATSFSGIIGFPAEVTHVLVDNSQVSPARYQTTAWIHIAGLPVFAVFATWCMLGAIQASRAPKSAAAPDAPPNVVRSPAEPARPVGAAEALFGTDDPETVRLQIDTFLLRHLGTGVEAIEFTKLGDGVVLGVLTHDARHVVVRVHPRGMNVPFRRAVQEVQLLLAAHGFPAPQPLLDAQPFGVGMATVESALVQLPPGDTRDRMIRRALADGLAAFIRLSAPLASRPEFAGRGPLRPGAPGSVFPPPFSSSSTTEPANGAIDYPATAVGAEWIEELGARARMLLLGAPNAAPVVGHFEWRDENIPAAGGRIAAVYAWNSIGTATEAVVVGSAAHQFTISAVSPTSPTSGAGDRPALRVPTLLEVQEFMTDYEAARGTPFTTTERVTARTAYVFCTAYGARCEHALAATGHPTSTAFREQLAAYGAALLG